MWIGWQLIAGSPLFLKKKIMEEAVATTAVERSAEENTLCVALVTGGRLQYVLAA